MTAPEPRVPVIDMWAPFVPSAEVIDDLREGFPVELLSYFEVFTKTTISAEQFGAYAESLRRTDDQILDSLDDAGITRSLITGFDERSTCGVTFVHNASVAAVAARYPDRFLPFAGRTRGCLLRSTPETSRRLRSQIRESPDSPGRFNAK
ncbi:predicted protein [Mycobacterium tuberculosis T17]|nr:predicted protein [Mycobacterium tuberculosis T17]